MHTQTHSVCSVDTSTTVANRVLRKIARLWSTWRNRRDVATLLDADDYMLRDIGITRADVVGALSTPRDHDPSDILVRKRNERLRNRAISRLGM